MYFTSKMKSSGEFSINYSLFQDKTTYPQLCIIISILGNDGRVVVPYREQDGSHQTRMAHDTDFIVSRYGTEYPEIYGIR